MSDWDFPPSKPRAVTGGIKAHSRRGAFASSWWGKRWIEVLEGFQLGGRLSRGRTYARKGQVTDVVIEAGQVTARVQGSRAAPYRVSIALPVLTAEQQRRIGVALGEDVLLASRLLAGELPSEVEAVFSEHGASLFPRRGSELQTSCSCPDWSNPCKHLAAVYYLLAEVLDADAFLLLRLRGMERDALLERVAASVPAARHAPDAEPLPGDPEAFWGAAPVAEGVGVDTAGQGAALLRRLGAFPLWRGEAPFMDTFEPTYAAAAERAVALLSDGI